MTISLPPAEPSLFSSSGGLLTRLILVTFVRAEWSEIIVDSYLRARNEFRRY